MRWKLDSVEFVLYSQRKHPQHLLRTALGLERSEFLCSDLSFVVLRMDRCLGGEAIYLGNYSTVGL